MCVVIENAKCYQNKTLVLTETTLATIATISATAATKMLPLKRVVARSIFEFLFQSFNNERNENDKDQSL